MAIVLAKLITIMIHPKINVNLLKVLKAFAKKIRNAT